MKEKTEEFVFDPTGYYVFKELMECGVALEKMEKIEENLIIETKMIAELEKRMIEEKIGTAEDMKAIARDKKNNEEFMREVVEIIKDLKEGQNTLREKDRALTLQKWG